MTLPKHIPTLCAMSTGNFTCPDNVFISSELADSVLQCTTIPEDRPARTDHFPISTILDIPLAAQHDPPLFNFRDTDWEKFRTKLKPKLDLSQLESPITDEHIFHSRIDSLTNAIIESIEATVPKSKPSSYAKCWWMKQIAAKRKEVKRLARKAH
ncbi:hypothetical protein K439DRAFT_1300029, partial [Ramaria rubella]